MFKDTKIVLEQKFPFRTSARFHKLIKVTMIFEE